MKIDKWNFDSIQKKYFYKEKEFSMEKYSIYSWSLSPKEYKYTVLLLHGFIDHSKTNLLTIKWLLEHSYRVIAADMPGHGKSSGIRGGIDSFETYSVFFQGLLDRWKINPSLSYALGHSTGASILIEYCRRNSPCFRGMIFAAPLVKIGNYSFVVKGYDLAQTKIHKFPIKKKKSCRNRSFLKYKWKDPLGLKWVSISWVKAMVEWNESWKDFTSNTPLLIIQGNKDSTVEWKINIPVLKRCFVNSETILVKRARHHILNEKEKIRKIVFKEIESFLRSHD